MRYRKGRPSRSGSSAMTRHDPTDPAARRLDAALRLVVRRYVRQVRARLGLAIPALLLPGIGSVLVFYVPPLVLAQVLGKLANDRTVSLRDFAPAIGLLSGAWLLGELLWRIAMFLMGRVESAALEALYVEAMEELLAKDAGFFHENFAGSLTKKALGYARRFEEVFDLCAFSVGPNVLPLTFVAVVLWRFSPWLIVALLGMILLTFLLVRPLIRRRLRLVHQREEASNVLAGHLADSIANAEAVRAFAREREEASTHARNVADFRTKLLRSWDYQNLRVDSLTSPLYVLTNTLGLVVALTIGKDRGLGVEAVYLTFSYFAQSTRVMWEFHRIYRTFEAALTDAAQFAELLLEPPAITDRVPTAPLRPRDTGVRFRSMRFAYGSRAPLFDRFDLTIAPGEKVGLVGRSGGGKTTLTRLLLRFSDVQDGAIEIGGQDIATVAQSSLRAMIASVPQDPAMFHRTIAENIRFGRPDATDAEIRRAAELAHAADFVEALPEGYDTLVGERGVKLSGGQRQRIAIARAILKDAPILVLDEATSALDSDSEMHIQEALWTLMERRTAIVIAHRLSTVRRMDRLVVLEGGRIVEEGSHDELLARGGTYAELWDHQSGGFLPATTRD